MCTNDCKFFTNEPGRSLYDRFTTILRSHTQFFDVLVGYFCSSGFFRIYKALETVEKIRILVGLGIDTRTISIFNQYKNELKYQTMSIQEARDSLSRMVQDEFNMETPSDEIEKGVRVFIDWLKKGKLELRMYTKSPIHAKVYIMRKDPEKIPDTFGNVITGSSNFSESGLVNNLEFNVELKDGPDVEFALNKFENLWNDSDSIDIQDIFIETIENKTWIRNDVTPYQIYLKTLYDFFSEEINVDKEYLKIMFPAGFMQLQYQSDAVIQAQQKLKRYNGVFLSDVVGLGKTYISAMLACTLPSSEYKLFICPPLLVDYWRKVLRDFGVQRFEVESLGKLGNILEQGVEKYRYVFVDEAHRFRNSDTDSYTKLHEICRGKKVILISATPYNNYTSDIENQIYLFQPKQNGTINGVKNLERFFRDLKSNLNKYMKGTPDYIKQLKMNSEIIRDRLLREIMIRRTRSEIIQYYPDDMKDLSFPKLGSPKPIAYVFDEKIDETFNKTIQNIRQFKYARYTPLLYLKNKKKYAQMMAAQRNIGGFMKGILVKRLESSFHAFKQTLARFIESYDKFIEMYKSGTLLISKDVNVYDLLDGGDNQRLFSLIEEGEIIQIASDEFDSKLLTDLQYDLDQLRFLQSLWSDIDTDPKLIQFKHELSHDPRLKGKKIIVFTESKETADYLYSELQEMYGGRLVHCSSQSNSSVKVEIENSFDPSVATDKSKDKYDMLITTDVLAEGVNLHRANVVINYDIPWNPTRIMQRVGRINRVGTTYDEIFVFNFFPTAQSSAQMPLTERILEKLQVFHDTLGDDFKYLSDEEEVSSQKLFTNLSKKLETDEMSTNPELEYLSVIRQVRDKKPELFETIKRLPEKIKAGKISQLVDNTATITFIRKGTLNTFFYSTATETKKMSFMDAIKFIECKPNTKNINVTNEYYQHYKNNNFEFEKYLVLDEEVTTTRAIAPIGNDAKIIKTLKALQHSSQLTEKQEENITKMISLWKNGDIPSKISKDVVKKMDSASNDVNALYFNIYNQIPAIYFKELNKTVTNTDDVKRVIASCFLRGSRK